MGCRELVIVVRLASKKEVIVKLVIVESPTKARTLSRYLGKGYEIVASMGHVRDLPKSKLGIDVKRDFAPKYVVVPDKEGVVDDLQAQAKKASEIYLSMDPDREGEAIAYHIKKLIGANKKFRRVVFHQITKSAIEEAFKHPRRIDAKLFDAQQARRVLDRLVGYTLSPLLWRKVRRGLSAGRVQSVAVRLIVEREREIEAFVPDEYWEIFVKLGRDSKDQKAKIDEHIQAALLKIDGEKAKVVNKKQADGIVSDLKKAGYTVVDVRRREAKRSPYPPFTTSTLQQAAANVLYYSAKRTMRLAQQLYERGYITYHRTDSVHLAPEAVAAARKLIKKNFGDAYLPQKDRRYKVRSKLAQEAHESIRPTRVRVDAETLRVKISHKVVGDLCKLYDLIWKRFVASQMSDAVYDQTAVDVEAKSGESSKASQRGKQQARSKVYLLRVSGSIRKFDGWRKLYKRTREDRDLPELSKGDLLKLVKVLSDQKFTEPPPRYSDASLVRAMEKRGIGRPSTYAPTISTILNRRYVEYDKRRFVPTPVGMATNDFLVGNFDKIVDFDFTAGMEEDLDKIAQGTRKWVPVVREFWGPFNKKASTVGKTAERVKVPTEPTGKKCPKCKEGDEVIRVGRYGKPR